MSTAVRQVNRVRPGDHLCLTFGCDTEQRELLTPFLAAGLARGEKVLYFSDGTVRESIDGWLRRAGVDSAPAWGRGQLELRSADDTYLRAGHFDPPGTMALLRGEAQRARAAGYQGVRITGEMSWVLRGQPGSARLPEYERRIQQVLAECGITAVCQYDRRLFDGEELRRYAGCHPLRVEANPVYEDHRLRVTPTFTPRGLQVAGTLDHASCDGLATVLDGAVRSGPGDLHLDMSRLDYIDVAGIRTLVDTARDLDPGRQLHLLHLAPMLRKVMTLVGWDETPRLVLSGDGRSA